MHHFGINQFSTKNNDKSNSFFSLNITTEFILHPSRGNPSKPIILSNTPQEISILHLFQFSFNFKQEASLQSDLQFDQGTRINIPEVKPQKQEKEVKILVSNKANQTTIIQSMTQRTKLFKEVLEKRKKKQASPR